MNAAAASVPKSTDSSADSCSISIGNGDGGRASSLGGEQVVCTRTNQQGATNERDLLPDTAVARMPSHRGEEDDESYDEETAMAARFVYTGDCSEKKMGVQGENQPNLNENREEAGSNRTNDIQKGMVQPRDSRQAQGEEEGGTGAVCGPSGGQATAAEQENSDRNDNIEGRPGAYGVPGRAFGEFPMWGRSRAQPVANDQDEHTNNGAALVRERRPHSELQATAVEDATPIVFPESVSNSSDIVRREQKQRKVFITVVLLLVALVGVFVGLFVSLREQGGAANAANDTGTDDNSTSAKCEHIPEDDFSLQCECNGIIEHSSVAVAALYKNHTTTLEIGPFENSSCSDRNKALWWLANDTHQRSISQGKEGHSVANLTEWERNRDSRIQTLKQRYVLALIYYSMGGKNWTAKGKWLSTEPECEWAGIVCSFENKGEIYELHLIIENGQNLTGSMAPELGVMLSSLRVLDLNGNQVTGNIPPNLLMQLGELRHIDLSNNQITGTLPDIENTTKAAVNDAWGQEAANRSLVRIDVSNNILDGTIPRAYSNLTTLREFRADGNRLKGRITTSDAISGFKELEVFSVSGNLITGYLPSEIGFLTDIEVFDISDNSFTGTLPTELGKLEDITTLRLGGNYFNGTMPEEILGLTQLENLDLRGIEVSQGLMDSICDDLVFLDSFKLNCSRPTGEVCGCCDCPVDNGNEQY